MTMSVMRLAALMMNNICVVREEGKKKKGWYSSWVGSLKYYIRNRWQKIESNRREAEVFGADEDLKIPGMSAKAVKPTSKTASTHMPSVGKWPP